MSDDNIKSNSTGKSNVKTSILEESDNISEKVISHRYKLTIWSLSYMIIEIIFMIILQVITDLNIISSISIVHMVSLYLLTVISSTMTILIIYKSICDTILYDIKFITCLYIINVIWLSFMIVDINIYHYIYNLMFDKQYTDKNCTEDNIYLMIWSLNGFSLVFSLAFYIIPFIVIFAYNTIPFNVPVYVRLPMGQKDKQNFKKD